MGGKLIPGEGLGDLQEQNIYPQGQSAVHTLGQPGEGPGTPGKTASPVSYSQTTVLCHADPDVALPGCLPSITPPVTSWLFPFRHGILERQPTMQTFRLLACEKEIAGLAAGPPAGP